MPKKSYRRRRYRKKGSLALKAYKMAKYAQSRVNKAEVNKKDRNGTSALTITHTTGIMYALNRVAHGDANGQRVGEEVQSKALHLKFRLTPGDQDHCTTIVIFKKLIHVNTVPTMSGTTTTNLLEVAHPLSGVSLRNGDKYRILYRETFVSNADGQEIFFRDIYKKFNEKMKYMTTAEEDAAQGENSLWLGCFTDRTDTHEPSIEFYCRYKYTDL